MSFLSTLPVRGATYVYSFLSRLPLISIHAPREGSDNMFTDIYAIKDISIHAPREGSDHEAYNIMTSQKDFYPRSP